MRRYYRIYVWAIVMVVLFFNVTQAKTTDTQPTPEQKRKMNEVFKAVKDKLVIVECDESCGSGFIMTMEDGKKFFVTNKHVVQGQKSVVARLLNGKKLPLGAFAVASNRDLVRFTLPDDVAALLLNSDEPNMGDSVYIFGNSDGSGVVTDLCGDVVGIGPEEIEVSAKFIHGNSGSAVFNDRGEVIGVATFATYDPNPEDWTKRDTRFSKVRRFAVRFSGVEWRSVRYNDFYKECFSEARKRLEEGLVVPQVSASFSNPKCYIARGPKMTMGGYRPTIIGSEITVSLSGGGRSIKTPIIRVCVLIKDDSGYHMRDCILTRIGSATGRPSPPVYAYGNEAEGIYHTDSLNGVYFLEGLSYWNGLFSAKTRSGIKYFDRTKPGGECLFTCHTDGRQPEIICFRFECWQNGALAGVYNSRSVTFLRSKGIPLDWYIRAKYPDKFDYSAINYPAGNS